MNCIAAGADKVGKCCAVQNAAMFSARLVLLGEKSQFLHNKSLLETLIAN